MKFSGPPSISSTMAVFPKGKGKSRYLPCIATWIRYKVDLSYNKARALGPKNVLCIVCWLPEGMERLTMTDEPEVGMKHGEV